MRKKESDGSILKGDGLLWGFSGLEGIDGHRFIGCCLGGLDQRTTLDEGVYYPVDIDSYARLGGISVGEALTELLNIADKLKHYDFRIKLENNSIWVTSVIYDYIYDKDAKILTIKWNKQIIPMISGDMEPGTFCYYDPRMYSTSNSRSLRLAELIQRNLWKLRLNQKYELPIALIRTITGTTQMYPSFRDLDKYVIQVSLKDLRKLLGIKLRSEHKRGAASITLLLDNRMNALPEDAIAMEIDQ